MTDITKVTIAAVDQASEVLARVETSFQRLQSSYLRMAALLGAGFSVAGLVSFAQSTIDAMAKMQDLAEMAGITAEAMSKFEAPTRVAGASLDVTAQAMARMSRAAVLGLDPLSAQGRAFAAIGISTRELRSLSPDQLFELIARQLAKYSDGISKNAVMQQIFSRSGFEMNSVMKQIAATTELHASVTQKDAEKAKAFQEEVVRLKMAGETFWRNIASAWIPRLTDLVTTFKEATEGAGLFKTTLIGLVAIFGGDASTADTIFDHLASTFKSRMQAMRDAFNSLGSFKDLLLVALGIETPSMVAAVQLGNSAASGIPGQTLLRGTIGRPQPTFYGEGDTGLPDTIAAKPAPDFDPLAAAAAEAFLARAAAELAKARGQAAAGTRQLTQAETLLLEIESDPKWAIVKRDDKTKIESTLKQAIAIERQKQALEDQKKAMEAAAKGAKDYIDALDKAGEVIAQFNDAATQQVSDLDFQNSLLGKSAEEQQKLTTLRQADLDLLKQIDSLPPDMSPQDYDEAVARLTKINDLRKEGVVAALDAKKAVENQLSVWGELGDKTAQFFSDLVQHGKTAFDGLKNMVKQFFAEMVALFAKRWVLQMVGTALGSSALVAQAGQTGQGTLAGTVLNYFTGTGMTDYNQHAGPDYFGESNAAAGYPSYMYGGNYGSSFGQTAGTVGMGAMGGYAIGAAGASMFGNSRNQATMQIGGALGGAAGAYIGMQYGSAFGPIGMVVGAIIGAILGSLIKSGGGLKTQGAFAGLFNGSGDFLGNVGNAEDIANIHGTQPDSNTQASQLGQAAARGIAQTLASLGGSGSSFQLFGGLSMDPRGTAPSMFHAGLRDAAGNEFFRYQNDNLSRDPTEFNKQVQSAFMRVTLAAIQHDATVPEAIKRWVQTVDATTASDADIQNVLKGAAALKSLIDDVGSLSDTLKELADPSGVTAVIDSLKGLDKTVADTKKALDAAAQSGDPQQYLTAEQAYKQAVMNRYQQEISMVRQLQDAIRQTQQAAYQFAINIAGRINAVGGNVDIGAIAMGRASSLQSGIGVDSTAPVATQIQDLQNYVGAIDTWYSARRQAILDDAQRQASAYNAAAQTRTQQLQSELNLVNQMKAVIDQAATMAKDMTLSASNPLSALGRLDLAKGDVDKLRAQFFGSTGADKVSAAQALLQALGTERTMAEGSLQRPSAAYQAVYNQIQADLALIGADAKTVQQQQLDLTQQIANSSKASASAATFANGQLAALDAQARGYYEWAQGEGARLYKLQEDAYHKQLMAITGGSDPELWIAQKTTEMRDLLQQLVAQNQKFLDGIGKPPGSSTTPDGTTTTDGQGNPLTRGGGSSASGQPKVIVIHSQETPDAIIRKLKAGGAAARRILEQS